MIALAINLAKQIGLRPAAKALRTVFEALNLDLDVPSHDVLQPIRR